MFFEDFFSTLYWTSLGIGYAYVFYDSRLPQPLVCDRPQAPIWFCGCILHIPVINTVFVFKRLMYTFSHFRNR